jgi:hypothetical protein
MPSQAKVKVNSNPVDITAYTINNNNYFKLRDIADYVGAEVTWDAENSEINITAQ